MKNKKSLIKIIVIVLIICALVVGGIVLTKKDEEKGLTDSLNPSGPGLEVVYDIVVEIKGEVRHPGIYTLPKDTRIQDLISLAGGLSSDADTSSINLASKLTDGMVVVIPKKSTANNLGPQDKVNINTATITELCTLAGIGEAIAQRIINYRTTNGFFTSIEEIKNVSGIGDALFEKIKDNITI